MKELDNFKKEIFYF